MRTNVFCGFFISPVHAGKLFVAGVIPHGQREASAEDAAERRAGRNERDHRIVVQVEKRNGAEPRDRNHHGDQQRDGKPSGDLNSARVQLREDDQHQRTRPPTLVVQ